MNQLGTAVLNLGRLCRSIRLSLSNRTAKDRLRFIRRTLHVPNLMHKLCNVFFDSDFKIQRRGRQRERQKNNRFYKENNNFARAPRFFVHFFARFCTTTT